MKKSDLFNGFTLFVFLVCTLTLTLNLFNGRFWLADFRVYYSAAHAFFSGGQVYHVSFDAGSGFYKYSPVVLLFFSPYCIFTYKIAALIHFVILSFAFWYAFIVIRDLLKSSYFPEEGKPGYLLIGVSFIPVLIFLSRELYLGNINVLLLLFCCLALKILQKNKIYAGSLLLAVVFITKPYFVILLLPLLIRRQWKPMLWTAIFSTGFLLLPFLFKGISGTISLYHDWVTAMINHDLGFPEHNSLEHILGYYFFPDMPGYLQDLILLLTGIITGFLIATNIKREQVQGIGENTVGSGLAFEWFLMLGLIPSLFKADWVQFMYTGPAIAYIFFYIARRKQYFLIPILLVPLFFFSANSDDLLGRELSHRFFVMGLTGISNIVLLAVAVVMFVRNSEMVK